MELLVFWDLAYCVGFDWLWTEIFRKIGHHNLEIRCFIHRLKIWSFLWCEFGRITVYLWAIIVKNLIYGLFGYCISEFGRLIWNWFLFYLDIVLYWFHTFCLRNIFLWWAHFDIWYHKNWIKIICQVVYWKWVYIKVFHIIWYISFQISLYIENLFYFLFFLSIFLNTHFDNRPIDGRICIWTALFNPIFICSLITKCFL